MTIEPVNAHLACGCVFFAFACSLFIFFHARVALAGKVDGSQEVIFDRAKRSALILSV